MQEDILPGGEIEMTAIFHFSPFISLILSKRKMLIHERIFDKASFWNYEDDFEKQDKEQI